MQKYGSHVPSCWTWWLCDKFGLPARVPSYTILQSLEWHLGQKLVTRDEEVYWATDTQYSTCVSKSGPRRDSVLLHGHETVKCTLPSGQVVERNTALCCQLVCFISLGNMTSLQCNIPKHVTKQIVGDKLTWVLVRWFSPHPTCTLRDSCGLPLCPPPLDINHALWEYAKTDDVRKTLWNADGTPTEVFVGQARMFGNNRLLQIQRHESESHAYYGLVKVSSIKCRTHMTPEFELHTVKKTNTWLQTIALA